MRNFLSIFFLLIGIIPFFLHAQQSADKVLFYKKPATDFNEALPIGNGRIGAMVYGGLQNETLNINEATLWGGGPANNNPNPNASQFLSSVRSYLDDGNWQQASRTLQKMQGPNVNSYVPLADVNIQQTLDGDVSSYQRNLDLSTAIATTQFSVGGVNYTREVLVSKPSEIIIMRMTASQVGKLNFSLGISTQFDSSQVVFEKGVMILKGQLPYHINSNRRIEMEQISANGQKGMRYQLRIKILLPNSDGKLEEINGLSVSNATEALVYITATTSYNGFRNRPDTEGVDENKLAEKYITEATKQNFKKIREAHVLDYQKYFNRVNLDLGLSDKNVIPTDERLANYKKGSEDKGLEVLYFNFGRYLLISSSRPGGVPANLQGIWNKNQRPSWGSNYTTNINVQMNYWPALMFNMVEMNAPLLDQIERWAQNGREIVQNYYKMNGWTVHHNSDIWATANPVQGDPKYANWALGGPWLSQHLYWHYQFTMDKSYLKQKAYPLMKEAARFCDDWLVLKKGYYVTSPSTSPENVFIDTNGNKGVVTIGSTMDMQIIWDLYNNLIEASETLNIDKVLRYEWIQKRDKLFPMRIGIAGNIMEWSQDFKDDDPQHRHVSHLFGLHPGRQLSPILTPDLAKAARKTLEIRGDGGTGWSKAWKVNFWSRLLDGEHAYKMYRELLSTSTLNNLLDNHPPFQIDGNFGGISGIGEMLLQSHLNELHLLPALPKKWENGSIEGMLARGGFIVDMKWENNKILSGKIKASSNSECKIRTDVPIKVKGVKSKTEKNGHYYLTTFISNAGRVYEFRR
ncbi:glycoside hydrolase family 95 protein [Sphingobacterium bovistauri]|uniref:Glycoside hydrolase family 95 protein n=1 Tax=Sphingobacterium bovistauri TaxID=2781959 RepID=A0ABS7Z0D5_9SPHI|nr:glycoside hydrolase family 95 protein [Sphingobacterium bovistauri]MCA5003637.1 glycoside hydrolase family 95 protein [Sphingobacterium bovistauri]